MGSSSHHSHFLADDERAAAESNEDLAHDDVADALVWLAEMDHEADTEDFKTQHGHGEPFEAAELADHDGEDDGPEAGADAVDVGDITCVRNGDAVDSLEVVVEG